MLNQIYTSQIVFSLGDIEITDQSIKIRSSKTFPFMNHLILVVLGDEIQVLVDQLHELGELLPAIGRELQRLKHRSHGWCHINRFRCSLLHISQL